MCVCYSDGKKIAFLLIELAEPLFFDCKERQKNESCHYLQSCFGIVTSLIAAGLGHVWSGDLF